MEEMIDSMIVDDKKEYSLFRITKNKITKSDHCTIFVELNIEVPREIKGDRFNVWNITSDGSSKFKELTENNKSLESMWQDAVSIESSYNKWFKQINSILHKCFKKRRVKNSSKAEKLPDLYQKLRKVQKEIRLNPDDELKEQENALLDDIYDKQKEVETWYNSLKSMHDKGTFNQNSFYKLKRQVSKKTENKTAVQKDYDNLITSGDLIKSEYANEFHSRLKQKTIDPEFKDIESNINELFNLCLELSQGKKTPQYNDDEIEKAISQLKRNQALDPEKMKTELFIEAGKSFRKSLKFMFNSIKIQKQVPTNWNKIIVSTFYKRKGSRRKLSNYRGIFLTLIVTKIFEHVLYNRIYATVEISDFQGGARKERGVHENLFMIRSAIYHFKHNNKPLILVMYDFKTCFDPILLKDSLVDIFFSGLKNLHCCFSTN